MKEFKEIEVQSGSDSDNQDKGFIHKTLTAFCGRVPFVSSSKNRGPQIVEKIVIRRPLSSANHQTEIRANSRPLSGKRSSPADNYIAQLYQLMPQHQKHQSGKNSPNIQPLVAPQPKHPQPIFAPSKAPQYMKAPQILKAPQTLRAPQYMKAPQNLRAPLILKAPSPQTYHTREQRPKSLPNNNRGMQTIPEQFRNTTPSTSRNLIYTTQSPSQVQPYRQNQRLKTVKAVPMQYVRVPSSDGCATFQLVQNHKNIPLLYNQVPAPRVIMHTHAPKIGIQSPILTMSKYGPNPQTPKKLNQKKQSEALTAPRERFKNYSSMSTERKSLFSRDNSSDNVSELVSQYNKTASKVEELLEELDKINYKIQEVKKGNSETDSKVVMQVS